MRLPVGVTVALALAREILRAAAFPLRCVAYLPRQRYWKARARIALAIAPPGEQDGAIAGFADRCRQPRGQRPAVFISTGETSGEIHAANVVRATRSTGLDARWTAFGGGRLRDAGCEVLFDFGEHAIMGLSGVVTAMPLILRAVARFVRMLREDPPDLVVLVDYPGLHVVLGRLARTHGVPVLHYIAPQYWAWAPWRMARYRRAIDAALTILPFEPAFWRPEGLRSSYVGHPLLDHLAADPPDADRVAALRRERWVCMLPGSRRAEIEANLGAFIDIAHNLRRADPDLRFVIPHTAPRRAARIRELLASRNVDFIEVCDGQIATWAAGARAVLAKSGTGSLEACLQGTPTVVIYRIRGPFAGLAYRTFITVPWIASANLIAGRAVVPEFVFGNDDGWGRVESALRRLLADGPEREACLEGLDEVRRRLGQPGASRRAARAVLAFFGHDAR